MKALALIVWMILSIILVFSIIGLLLFIPGHNGSIIYIPASERRSIWLTMGMKLLDNFIKQ